jgi:hypothetical protein
MRKLSALPGAEDRRRADNSEWGRRLVVAAVVIASSLAGMFWIIHNLSGGLYPDDFLTFRYGVRAADHGVNIYHHDITGPLLTAPHGAAGQPFTYPPFGTLALWPTTLGGWHACYLFWCAGSVLVLGWALARFVPEQTRYRPAAIAAVILVASLTCIVQRHVQQGQVNTYLMGLVLADLFRRDDTRFARVLPHGVLVGIATAIKLTPGLFIVFFLLTRQWRLARASIAGAVAATLLGALVYPRMTGTFLHGAVWSLADKVDTFDDPGNVSNTSVGGALHALGSAGDPFATPLAVVTGLLALFAAYRVHSAGRAVDAWLIIGLAAPLVSPVSWVPHGVYLLPAMTLLAFDTAAGRTAHVRNVIGIVIAVAMLHWGPWGADTKLQGSPSAGLVLPLVLQRECALLASIACIVALYARRPVRTRKIRVTPEVGQLATP